MSRIDIHIGEEVFEDWGKSTLKISEGVAIEKVYGKTFDQFIKDLVAGSMYAVQVLVWSLMRRTRPELRVGDVDDLPYGDITIVEIPDEVTEGTGEEADPFKPGSSEAGQDSSPTGESAT